MNVKYKKYECYVNITQKTCTDKPEKIGGSISDIEIKIG